MITVLGASGFIGTHIAGYLNATGVPVWAPDRNDPEILTRDLGDVVYAIGLTADFRTRPYETMDAHVSRLSDVLSRGNFDRLLYLSSTRVYGRAESGVEDADILVNPADPSDLYNLSKLAGESLCRAAGNGVRIARLSNIIGRDPESENFVSALVREAVQSGRIELQSNPRSAKDYLMIHDAVDAIVTVLRHGDRPIYNIASGVQRTAGEIAKAISRATSAKVEVAHGAPQFDFPEINVSRLSRAYAALGRHWSPADVLDHLEDLVAAALPAAA